MSRFKLSSDLEFSLDLSYSRSHKELKVNQRINCLLVLCRSQSLIDMFLRVSRSTTSFSAGRNSICCATKGGFSETSSLFTSQRSWSFKVKQKEEHLLWQQNRRHIICTEPEVQEASWSHVGTTSAPFESNGSSVVLLPSVLRPETISESQRVSGAYDPLKAITQSSWAQVRVGMIHPEVKNFHLRLWMLDLRLYVWAQLIKSSVFGPWRLTWEVWPRAQLVRRTLTSGSIGVICAGQTNPKLWLPAGRIN